MRRFRLHCPVLLVLAALCGASGCQMFGALKPTNTWRLNRGPALDEGDAYFSISDPAATLPRGEDRAR